MLYVQVYFIPFLEILVLILSQRVISRSHIFLGPLVSGSYSQTLYYNNGWEATDVIKVDNTYNFLKKLAEAKPRTPPPSKESTYLVIKFLI